MSYTKKHRGRWRRLGDYPDDPTPDMCAASPGLTGCPPVQAVSTTPSIDSVLCQQFGVNCFITASGSPESTTTSTTATSETPSSSTAAASNWTSVGGVCKATNATYLAAFKELQRQLNRVLDTLGVAKIAVDGAIGPGTLAALQTIGAQATSASSYGLTGINLTCANVAANVQRLTLGAQRLADFLNVPSSVSSPAPAETPSYVDLQTGQVTNQPIGASAMDAFNNLSTTQKLALGAGLALAGFYATRKHKKKTNRTSRRY